MSAHHPPGPEPGPETTQAPVAARAFKPGPGFAVALVLALLVVVLALSAAISGALGATGASRVLGGGALILVGTGMLALLRVPARSLVVNAPRLRLERNRARAALARRRDSRPEARRGQSRPDPAAPGRDLVALRIPGTDVVIPESTGRRELTTIDVVSGPVTSALATTRLGRAADERLAGTTTGEALVRVTQLLAGATGFVLLALGLASILGQVMA